VQERLERFGERLIDSLLIYLLLTWGAPFVLVLLLIALGSFPGTFLLLFLLLIALSVLIKKNLSNIDYIPRSLSHPCIA
jgi:uncharacterized RDD family membrane protein YckC